MVTTRTLRVVASALLATGALAVLLILLGRGDSGHRVTAVVPAATNLVKGQEINAGGRKIGSVTAIEPVDGGRAARLKLEIDDEKYWPLASDTKLEVRFGGTVSFSNRYLLLTRGKRTNDLIPEGGELPKGNVKVPVEVDQLVSAFNPPVRRDIRNVIGNSAEVLDGSSSDLNRALGVSAPVTLGASRLFSDLTTDRQELEALVASSSRVVAAIDRSSPDLRVLLDGAATTFDAIASQAAALGITLDRLPATLTQTRATLARARGTLGEAGALTERLAPGIEQLRLIARPLTTVLAGVRDVTPSARQALRLAPDDAESLADSFDDQLTPLAPQLGSIGTQATKTLDCVRPYAPEIVMFGTTWGDWMSTVDDRDHMLRATVQNYFPAQFNSVPLTAGEASKLYSGMKYGFPWPPGALAGQPWYQPQCGAGPDAMDPTKDPEGANFRARQEDGK